MNEEFVRSDIWREGKWLDLWSLVHVITGISFGLGMYLLHLGAIASTLLVFVLLVTYEMWEAMVKIIEAPTNRFTDVVFGMTGFLPTFFMGAPLLVGTQYVEAFIVVLGVNIALSILGWHASQKAAALEKRMRVQYTKQRARLLHKRAYLHDTLEPL